MCCWHIGWTDSREREEAGENNTGRGLGFGDLAGVGRWQDIGIDAGLDGVAGSDSDSRSLAGLLLQHLAT